MREMRGGVLNGQSGAREERGCRRVGCVVVERIEGRDVKHGGKVVGHKLYVMMAD